MGLGQGNSNIKNIFVGMELDDMEIRAVELDLSAQMPSLSTAGKIKLENGIVVDGIVKNPAELAKSLKELWASNSFTSDKVLLGIGSSDILIRFASIPSIQNELIKAYIRNQSQDFFPVSINDYEMDFMELARKTDGGKSILDIIIVAARNSMIRSLTASLELAGLSAYEIDISALSLMRYAELEYSDSTTIIANLGYGKMDMIILSNEIPVFAKTSSFDVSSLFDEDSATNSIYPPPDVPPIFTDITYEIKSLVNYCFSLQDAEPASTILLCGPVSRINGLDLYISEQTKTSTVLINPFKAVNVGENVREKIMMNSADFAVCASLALRGLEV